MIRSPTSTPPPPPPTIPPNVSLALEFGTLVARLFPNMSMQTHHQMLAYSFREGLKGRSEPLGPQGLPDYERQAAHLAWHLGKFIPTRFPPSPLDVLSSKTQEVNGFLAGLG